VAGKLKTPVPVVQGRGLLPRFHPGCPAADTLMPGRETASFKPVNGGPPPPLLPPLPPARRIGKAGRARMRVQGRDSRVVFGHGRSRDACSRRLPLSAARRRDLLSRSSSHRRYLGHESLLGPRAGCGFILLHDGRGVKKEGGGATTRTPANYRRGPGIPTRRARGPLRRPASACWSAAADCPGGLTPQTAPSAPTTR